MYLNSFCQRHGLLHHMYLNYGFLLCKVGCSYPIKIYYLPFSEGDRILSGPQALFYAMRFVLRISQECRQVFNAQYSTMAQIIY